MHPGPVNRGVELSAYGDRLATGADRRAGQGRGRGPNGSPLRAARWLAAAFGGRMSARAPEAVRRAAAPRRAADPRSACARPPHRARRAPRHPDPRRRDRRARPARVASGARRGRRLRRRRQPRFPSVRGSARPPAHPGPGVQGDIDDRDRRGRRRRLLRGDRDAEHRPGRRRPGRARLARRPSQREARVPVGFLAAITRGLQGDRAHRDGRAQRRRRTRVHRRRQAGQSPLGCCARRFSTSASAAA